MPPIPDLVKLSKLEAQCVPGSQYTERVEYVSENTLERRKFRKEETWKKQKRLGRGAFGDVWLQRCIDGENQGKLQAVKEIQKLEDNNFYKELEAIALFSHDKYKECFVRSYGWYDDDDSIFITMEYLANGDLHKYLGSPLPENEGKIIVLQTLEGLNYMHQNGFAHRDMKPANILVVHKGPRWWVKIADFGISKRTSDDLTVLRTQAGTPAFAAPELLLKSTSELQYTNAIDIWALGVITFLILTGKTLFVDHHPGQRARYIDGNFKFPFEDLLANNISQKGCDFVKKLMAVEANNRPGAEESLQSSWLAGLKEPTVSTLSRTIDISNNSSKLQQGTLSSHLVAEASASWSTHNPSLSNLPLGDLETFTPEADPQSPSFSNNHSRSPLFSSHISKGLPLPGPVAAEQIMETKAQVHIKLPATLEGHTSSVRAVAFSPDGKQIASASFDQTVRLWDSASGAVRATLKGHTSSVSAVAFSPDGKQIASASQDQTVRLWDSASGAVRATLKGHTSDVWAIAFSPDGKQIASASQDQTVRLWDSATRVARATLKGHTSYVSAVAFSPDGKQIASASIDQTVRLWDSATGAARATLKGHTSGVSAVAFSPDGKQIASASQDQTVRLWDSATGAVRATLKGHTSGVRAVAFSPDGKQIASASQDQTVRRWDSATRVARATLKGHTSYVWAIAFSPDGKQIVSASFDQTVRLWDSATGAARAALKGHTSGVSAVAFSPDGKQIASASIDQTVRLWDSATRAARKESTIKKYLSLGFK